MTQKINRRNCAKLLGALCVVPPVTREPEVTISISPGEIIHVGKHEWVVTSRCSVVDRKTVTTLLRKMRGGE